MNILVLCTYPIQNPRHGGQIRVHNIVNAFRADNHYVDVVGVLGSTSYEAEDGFVSFPGIDNLSKIIQNVFLMEDYAIGRLFAENDFFYSKLANQITKIPDVIYVEQPWLFAFAVRYSKMHRLKSKLIYGSQNIEYRLKYDIVSSYFDVETAHQYSELVKSIELDAVTFADNIICVSDSDKKTLFTEMGRLSILAPNGVSSWPKTAVKRIEAQKISKNYRYALYCASAHPPNMTGFFSMFGGGFGSLRPDEKLIVAGGASWAIAGDKRVHESAKLAEKVVVAGIVSQPCLEGLLDGTQCIVLPITQGGGTNLKTAEALWSGKYIVATTIAMRGFEQFIGEKGVYIADDATLFKQTLRCVMQMEPLQLSTDDIEARRVVLWSSCLMPLRKVINDLDRDLQA